MKNATALMAGGLVLGMAGLASAGYFYSQGALVRGPSDPTRYEASENKTLCLSTNSVTVLNVQTDLAAEQPLRRTLRVAGKLEANEASRRVIAAGRAGRIERVGVPYVGFEVGEGDRLAGFFIPELLAETRRYVLLGRSGATAGGTKGSESSNPILSTAQSLRSIGLTDAQIDNLARTGKPESSFDILSPVTGTVVERNVSEGQYVIEGTTLFTIVDLSSLWFRFDVYERDLAWLKPGQIVEFSVRAAPGRVFSGPITFIDPFVDETTRTAKVRVEVANPVVEVAGVKQRLLKQQLYAEGCVQVETPVGLTVPASAVLNPGGVPYTYVARGNEAYELRKLKLGRRADNGWEVIEGLEAGDQVVTTGTLLVDTQAQFNRYETLPAERPQPAIAAPSQEAMHPFPHANQPQAAGISVFQQKSAEPTPPIAPDPEPVPGLVASSKATGPGAPVAAAPVAASSPRASGSPLVQPRNSRDHSVYENRMKAALATRFSAPDANRPQASPAAR